MGTLDTDLGTAVVHYSATCESPGNVVLQAVVCQGLGTCQQTTDLSLDISTSALCNPRPAGCGEGNAGAGMCCFGPAGASAPDGSPPGFSVPGTNAKLVYQAQGVGQPGTPGAATWISVSGLGRYWIHEFATRIVSTSPYSTAWLITPGGTFRHFTDTNADGLYDEATPSDEFRTLEHDAPLTGEWTLTDLDGTKTVFNSDGSWQSTTDRLGYAWTGTYSGGLLATVSFPDGRTEHFTYVGGRLSKVEQVGLDDDGTQSAGSPADCSDDSECRIWNYTWNGDDLARLEYPDGTAREFFYTSSASYPGYMTRRDLVGADGTSRRVEAAWSYTAGGRIEHTWKGATSYGDPAAVETYDFSSYDDETRPTSVDVTDPFGQVATYTIGYDATSTKPRLESIAGQCPSCGGPDDAYEYDPGQPLLPTARIDGDLHRTELTYNADGTVATRTEAAGTSNERITTYGYDTTFPGLRTFEQRPSTGGAGFRETTWSYDGTSGVLLSRTISGDEPTYDADGDGTPEGAFSLTTSYTDHNAAGQPGRIDPPGSGTLDSTTFTYFVPGRNGLLVNGRTDPLIGTTGYDYDGLNRRTRVADPNGVETATVYDRMDRVQQVTQAAGTAEALTTTYAYDTYGDLASVVDPKGHVTAYEYDYAGRLTGIRRQDGATVAAGDERTAYTLNSFGQRTREEEQVWDGSAWQTKSTTEYDYSSRCYLDRVIHDPDDGGTEVTEYAYDCDRKLAAVWDAEHPSDGHPPSKVYVYDELDRLTEVREPWVPDTDCRGVSAPVDCAVTSYGYDVQDHLTAVTDAEGTTTGYDYSDRDRMIYEASLVSGMTAHRYDDHGELVETTDGRGITVKRTLDLLDRVTQVDYPGTTLDTTYTYDTAPTACPMGGSYPIGRLSSILRDGSTVDSCYDRFGRTTLDGELAYTYDDNGNIATMTYPGGVEATYSYDLADRPTALSVTTPANPTPLAVASGGTYLPAGPLTSLTFGNGTSEARSFTKRYFPETITWTGGNVRTWTYTEDHVGNITSITGTQTCAGDVTIANQTLMGTQTVESCADLVLGPSLDLDATADVAFQAAGAARLDNGFSVASGGQMSVTTGATVQPPTDVRTFDYQDGPYFLTLGDGPWGERDWTYDRIGNRTSERRDRSGTPETDSYAYDSNGSGGHTAFLDLITLAPTGTADYEWDNAGNLDTLVRGANHIDVTFDEASRLSQLDRGDGSTVYDTATFLYDGRGFLRQAEDPASGATVEPLYDSAGLLHALVEKDSATAPERRHTLFYLAGRPVAQLTQDAATSTETWQYLTTDHLGTPRLAADDTGAVTWSGGFEPFGHDYAEGSMDSALDADLFLRLPGQWETGLWAQAALGSGGIYYNVNRWVSPAIGRYTRADPLGLLGPEDLEESYSNLFIYGVNQPLLREDPSGLVVLQPDSKIPGHCKRRWRKKVLPRLMQLTSNQDCTGFFCSQLNADLTSLLTGTLPVIKVYGNRSTHGGHFDCSFSLNLNIGLGSFCASSVEDAVRVVLHETAHFADCLFNTNRFPSTPLTPEEGCAAETACFGSSIGQNCRKLGYPYKEP